MKGEALVYTSKCLACKGTDFANELFPSSLVFGGSFVGGKVRLHLQTSCYGHSVLDREQLIFTKITGERFTNHQVLSTLKE